MNFILKVLLSIIITLIIISISSVIFNTLDIEKYIYIPYVSWFVLLIILFLFLPSNHPSIFLPENESKEGLLSKIYNYTIAKFYK
jgi:hypothetical protein